VGEDIREKLIRRWKNYILEKYGHGIAPELDFVKEIPLRISRDEFHELCKVDSIIYDTKKLLGISLLIENNKAHISGGGA